MNGERWYVFTFCIGGRNAGHYVRVYGTYDSARATMCEEYGKEWAFQYDEEDWKKTAERMASYGLPVETEIPFGERLD